MEIYRLRKVFPHIKDELTDDLLAVFDQQLLGDRPKLLDGFNSLEKQKNTKPR